MEDEDDALKKKGILQSPRFSIISVLPTSTSESNSTREAFDFSEAGLLPFQPNPDLFLTEDLYLAKKSRSESYYASWGSALK